MGKSSSGRFVMMKKFIETIKKEKYIITSLFCIIFSLIVISLPILIGQARNFKFANITNFYTAKYANNLIVDKAALKENDLFNNNSDGYYYGDFYVKNFVEQICIDYDTGLYLYTKNHDMKIVKNVYVYMIVECADGEILKKPINKEGAIDNSTGIFYQQTLQGDALGEKKNNILISYNFNIDYNKVVETYTNIKGNLNITTGLIAYLQVIYRVDCIGEVNTKPYNYTDVVTSRIPLSELNTFSVTHNFTPSTTKTNNDVVYVNKVNCAWFTFGVLCDIVALVLTIIVIYALVKIKNENSKLKLVNKYLNEYNDIIIRCTKEVKLKNNSISTVKDFKDLVKAEVEMQAPINYIKVNNEHKFFVYGKGITYYYTIIEDIDYKTNLDNQQK